MKVKQFRGATSREVLKAVREALGESAIILSNRNVGGGVEVLAVAERDMASIVAPSTPNARRAAPASEIEVRRLLHGAREHDAGRSERRVHHALPVTQAAEAEASGDPVSSEIKSMRDLLERQFAALAARSQGSAPVAAELVAEMKSMRGAMQQQMANLARAAAAQKALADRNLAAENVRLAAQVGTLRSLVESEWAGLAWGEAARRHPARAEALRRCLQAGFSAVLARAVAETVPAALAEHEVPTWLTAALQQRLAVAAPESIIERGGAYALIGPTGVGKTTTTAKLAARCAMKFGARRLALITMDTYRIGAHDHLRAYGRILGVPVHTAHDAATLADVLGSLDDKHLVLIDTAGLAQRDDRVGTQLQSLAANGVQRLLVLNAAAQPETLDDVVAAYRGDGLAGCLLTKIDEAVKFGGALDVLLRHGLALHYVANGQRVPEDLHAPNVRYLVHRALRSVTPPAYALHDDEMGMMAVAQRPVAAQHAV